MDLERLIAALDPVEVERRAPVEVLDLAYDAAAVSEGSLFFCVRGMRADGHDFAAAALERGAVALVVEEPLKLEVPQLVVESARAAMAPVADVFFGQPTRELTLVGVTGTNGKTTTCYLVYEILAAAGKRPGLLGTVESRIGGEIRKMARTTPEAIDLQRIFREMLGAGDRSCVMEASSHAIELHRLDCVRFSALAFTNLSQDHLDFHQTMERYFTAKRKLFLTGAETPAAINIDDAWGRRLAADLRALGQEQVLTFGRAADADLRADEIELTPEGTRIRAGELELSSPLRGAFNAENLLAAVALSRLLGVGDEAIASGVAALKGVPGRFESIDRGQPFAVVVDYAHTPDALARVLRAARELAHERLICVFGCGGDRDREKRPLMGEIAADLSDLAIVTSDNPRSEEPRAIIDEILSGIGAGEIEVEPDRRKAIGTALEQARAGDVVVIAGKGHEQGQEIAGRVFPFDDREVAVQLLEELGKKR
ncbi:MAG: UDP-N-acetylmuramoyl-L-alanyl-D-glutamate--2,6-diaminopimelate ligase [Gaiellaceae bacterium]|jgi:UDP-N-acetylmuramoyl-L-alanyl-D-glutamate--2,6-diaminopimelate ligase